MFQCLCVCFRPQLGLSISSCLSGDSQATSSILSGPGQWPHPPAPFRKMGWWMESRDDGCFSSVSLSPHHAPPPPLVFLSCPCWRYKASCLNVHVELLSCSFSFYPSFSCLTFYFLSLFLPFLVHIFFPLAFYFHPKRFSLSLCASIFWLKFKG